jgi:hypothetical protein
MKRYLILAAWTLVAGERGDAGRMPFRWDRKMALPRSDKGGSVWASAWAMFTRAQTLGPAN